MHVALGERHNTRWPDVKYMQPVKVDEAKNPGTVRIWNMFVWIAFLVNTLNSQSLHFKSAYVNKFWASGNSARYLVMRQWTAALCEAGLSTQYAAKEVNLETIVITAFCLLLNEVLL